ncbi:hypothetical protein LTR04_006803, partial [Oleoguttula sp. CCFEE 6159]
ISAGLASSYAASALLGTGGAVALLIVLFMAVTSCASAELIAVSSILTFDIYKTYIKPTASPSNLIFVSHVMICVFGSTMAAFACVWNAIGIDLGWLFLVMGLLIGGAVFPAAFAITWRGQTKAGAISGAVVGLTAGVVAWLVTAKHYYGNVSVATTGMEYPTLAGNLAAIMTGLIMSVSVSLIKPANFDWEITRAINAKPLTVSGTDPTPDSERSSTHELPAAGNDEKKKKGEEAVVAKSADEAHSKRDLPTTSDEEKETSLDTSLEEEPAKLRGASKLACLASFVLTFLMDFLIPMPMFFSHYLFSKPFFTAWVVISFIWVFCSAAVSTILPIVETAGFFGELMRDVWADLRGRGARRRRGSVF